MSLILRGDDMLLQVSSESTSMRLLIFPNQLLQPSMEVRTAERQLALVTATLLSPLIVPNFRFRSRDGVSLLRGVQLCIWPDCRGNFMLTACLTVGSPTRLRQRRLVLLSSSLKEGAPVFWQRL
jgi:hypothetical protein